MEEAFEAERKKASRSYDGMPEFSEPYKKKMDEILTTAATLERGYQAFLGNVKLVMFRSQINELDKLHRKWLDDLGYFKKAIKDDFSTTKMQQEYVDIGLNRIAKRIDEMAKQSAN